MTRSKNNNKNKNTFGLFLLLHILSLVVTLGQSFSPLLLQQQQPQRRQRQWLQQQQQQQQQQSSSLYHSPLAFPSSRTRRIQQITSSIRGGATITSSTTTTTTTTVLYSMLSTTTSPIITWVLSSISQPGNPWGVLGLATIASAVCLPAVQIKNLYGISVGYGFSVAAIAAVLRWYTVPWSISRMVVDATLFYGLRLALHLLIRDLWNLIPRTTSKRPEPSRWKRIPFALSVSIFYALETTPLLYLVRSTTTTTTTIQKSSSALAISLTYFGAALAWFGAILEAVADTHKFWVKWKHRLHLESNTFHGPTSGTYRFTRHPNYTGEVVFWMGLYMAGIPYFGTSTVAWICSTAGLYGIVQIMIQATRALEQRQAEKYSEQITFQEWKRSVPSPLLPFRTSLGQYDVEKEEDN